MHPGQVDMSTDVAIQQAITFFKEMGQDLKIPDDLLLDANKIAGMQQVEEDTEMKQA